MKRIVKLLLCPAACLLAASQAFALDFANGSFEGLNPAIGRDNHNSAMPPGWSQTGGTPDTFNPSAPFHGYVWAPSDDGGDFLHGIGWQPSWTESATQDALDGLVIGQTYEISFEQSISNSQWSDTGGFWRIQFGDEIQDSVAMAMPALGVAHGWNWYTMFFTATAVSQNLKVSAWSDTNNVRTDLGIDGFYLGDVRPNPPGENLPPTNSVPDSGTTALMLGVVVLGLARFKNRFSRSA